MGRCQSTPGLVETRGRTPIEEMWLCQSTHTALTYYNPQSVYRYTFAKQDLRRRFLQTFTNTNICPFSRPQSPRSSAVQQHSQHIGSQRTGTERKVSMPAAPTPCSLSPSSDERPRSRVTLSRPQSQPSRGICTAGAGGVGSASGGKTIAHI